jgi:nicotinate phosphoribosyltransferase
MMYSILDTDAYKLSMSYAYFTLYPLAEGTFKFNDRNKEDWRNHPEFLKRMKNGIDELYQYHLKSKERDWCIKHIQYIPQTYWEWLETFRFDPSKVNYWIDENGVFQCEVTDVMYKVTLYEIVILSLYSEIRNEILYGSEDETKVAKILMDKINYANANNVPFADFGTRRRFSPFTQELCIQTIKKHSNTCKATSNVYLAMKYDLIPTGTMAHEWIMFHASCFGYKRANYLALEDWIQVFKGDLGTALIDTYTTDSFLRTLTKQQALLLQGFRQDSGDEFEVGEKIIARLKEFGIDPRTKVIVFSNALDINKAKRIKDYFGGKCKVAFGIGTNITCDLGIEDFKAPNIVMKLSRCRLSPKDPWEDSIKISDDFGKHMGNEKEFEIAKYELKLTI